MCCKLLKNVHQAHLNPFKYILFECVYIRAIQTPLWNAGGNSNTGFMQSSPGHDTVATALISKENLRQPSWLWASLQAGYSPPQL